MVSLSTLAAAGFTWVTIHQATDEQYLTRDGQVTDRYNAAVTNLGDDAEEVRIGGLYALQRIAQDSPRDAPTVAQVISAYVRTHAPQSENGTKPPDHPANDIDAALHILIPSLAADARVDLRGANLHGLVMQWMSLPYALLSDVDLTGADLFNADLHGADLNGAHLNGAELGPTNLESTGLRRADLERADLRTTDLNGADLTGANLTGADLDRADLTGANLTEAHLTGANLTEAHLTGANLTGADLTGANLTGVDLTGVDLTGARGYKLPPGQTHGTAASSSNTH